MTLLTRLALGVIGGFSATAPMTAAMLALHRKLPAKDRYPLPPREITAKLVDLPDPTTNALVTLANHFAYGSAMGLVYAAANPHPSRHWLLKGTGSGLAVWAISYFLILPALRILRPAHLQPERRNFLMIVAHLVWGAVLAGFYESTTRDEISKGLVSRSPRAHQDQS